MLCGLMCVCVFTLATALPRNVYYNKLEQKSDENEYKSEDLNINENKFVNSEVNSQNLLGPDVFNNNGIYNNKNALQPGRSIRFVMSILENINSESSVPKSNDQVRRFKRNMINSGVCPKGQVMKPFPFGCITCKQYEELTDSKC